MSASAFSMPEDSRAHGRTEVVAVSDRPCNSSRRRVNMETYFAYYDSPIGLIEVGGTNEGITSLFFVEERRSDVTSTVV